MDEFAQTRGVDDLFDDEIVPVVPSQAQVEYTEDVPSYNPSQPDAAPSQVPPEPARTDRRKRGNGKTRGTRGGLYSRGGKANGPVNRNDNQTESEPSATTNGLASSQPDKETAPATGPEAAPENNDELQAKDAVKPKVPAVRGDRSATGGIKKPKLTEEELSERMAAVKIAAAKRAAAHARAEADKTSFHERERIAKQRRAEDARNHRAMVGERERNRQRKLQAQTGREWDAEKSQDAFSDRGRGGSAYRRGVHGGIASETRHIEDSTGHHHDSDNDGFRGRGNRYGRGGQGRGYGRGRGRGGFRGTNEAAQPDVAAKDSDSRAPPAIEAESEFPALPSGKSSEAQPVTVTTQQPAAPATSDTPISPMPLQESWADHVDALHEAAAEKKAANSA
ncbi:predicted protein [Uncinocarpus reesii 1704]|uniref:Uncharacterized protein n=1 Tax=Uncinocarpus reesii (strain UAMH 1704) TaxID=336963 RepID=C4JH18_UNCRE|nr:uncharacterized protein UREG_01269 [Uncinocarpus reesii 1704]EEP76420.1 predicted protein [Uncinocarpus reesii 1704]